MSEITPTQQLRLDCATVMGWTMEESNPVDRVCWHLNGIQSEVAAPDYDTDLVAAMELVAWMRQKGFNFTLIGNGGSHYWPGWYAKFSTPTGKIAGWDLNPATAICKAFLAKI